MKFHVVTPSFNQLDLLRRCVFSVKDQVDQDIVVHHHVQDGGSSDGTTEWLLQYNSSIPGYRLTHDSTPDEGMYDAINKGWSKADEDADVLCWLNCDEQYLVGALASVAAFLKAQPNVMMAFGSALIVGEDGALIAFRKSYRPWWPYIVNAHLYNLSCAMFIRHKIVRDGFKLNTEYRDVGDSDFVVRCLKAGYRAKAMSQFLSSFTWTGANMSCGENARAEAKRLRESNPRWIKRLSVPLEAMRYFEKFTGGAYYHAGNFEYSLYTSESGEKRHGFSCEKTSWRWPKVITKETV